MTQSFVLNPVGTVRNPGGQAWIEVFDEYGDALLGLDGFSHIHVFYWFDQNDSPEKRRTLQVHPRKDPANPLTGVFATHSPRRPNLIAMTLCRIRAIRDNRIEIDEIDAYDGSPVLDIKCYIPESIAKTDVQLPGWVRK